MCVCLSSNLTNNKIDEYHKFENKTKKFQVSCLHCVFVIIYSINDCSSLSALSLYIIISCLLEAFYRPNLSTFFFVLLDFVLSRYNSWKVSNARHLYCSNFSFGSSIYLFTWYVCPYLIFFLKMQLQVSFVIRNHRAAIGRMDQQTPLTQNDINNVLRCFLAGAYVHIL